jgi:hypothetical protein
MNSKGEQIKIVAIRALAVIGFIAILLAGLWGTVQLVKFSPKVFSGLSASVTSFMSVFVPNEEITVNNFGSIVLSNTSHEINWEHKNKPENVNYSFSYACVEGLSIQTLNNGDTIEIKCDSPFYFSSDTNSFSFTPKSEKIKSVNLPVVITSINKDGVASTLDDGFITIINESIQEEAVSSSEVGSVNSTTAGEKTYNVFPISGSRTVSDPNGRVDLETKIIETGFIDSNNIFIPTSSIDVSKNGAVRFSITNIGTKASDTWTFNAVLPTYPMHIFHSQNQKALQPGDRIDFTLGFDQINRTLKEGVITINVDPAGSIKNEINRNNNIAQVTISITK